MQGQGADLTLANLTLAYSRRMAGLLQRELSDYEESEISLRAAHKHIQAYVYAEEGDVNQSLILLETIIDLAE